MKFLLDMNLSPRLAKIFRERGYESVHWIDVGSPKADDKDILHWAGENGWIIVTNDLDFGAILVTEGLCSPSVIQTRRLELSPETLFPFLEQVIKRFADELEQGVIVVVDEKKMRARLLPVL
jgi:predicted nuclease of predicted toxin-antitoxin system